MIGTTHSNENQAPPMPSVPSPTPPVVPPVPTVKDESDAKSNASKRQGSSPTRSRASTLSISEFAVDASPSKSAEEAKNSSSRLAELDKALAIALEEQKSLSSELEHLRNTNNELRVKADDEAEQKRYWQKKHSTLQAEFDDLRERFVTRDQLWKSEWQKKSGDVLDERDELREKLHAAQKMGSSHEEEAIDLRRQLLDLKHSISTSTRMESQVTDQIFAQEMVTLNHEIQNWVVNNFRRTKSVDFSNLPSTLKEALGRTVPLYETLARSAKLSIYQAMVMSHLMEVFNAKYFFGLPHDGPFGQLESIADHFRSMQASADAPSVEYSQWRSTTFELVRQSDDGDLADHTSFLTDQIVDDVDNILSDLTATESSSARLETLRSIVERAIAISRLFSVQRAEFSSELPCSSAMKEIEFDGALMEDINGEDATELERRAVQCATFPVVYKIGDERGENLHLRNVIMKAKVLCGETGTAV
ncbi:hypothetical protein LTR04_000316 [Oleoguttula sp. CCFEE 6159]|nr:hypothetical protein LTR04_000316 [Oleoguttula sp. CCFEE 6159]